MDKKPRPSLARLHTRPGERNWAMTKMGVGTGFRVAGHSFANLFRRADEREASDRDFYRREAEKLTEQLGALKGSVMKAGQMLSLYGQYFMPPEAIEALSTLQDDTAHVSWEFVAPVVYQSLAEKRLAEIEIQDEPIAAASLGQVHRARLRNSGREVCVKIRYPGVDEAIDSDVRTIQRLLSLSRLVPRDLSLEPVFTEVREMLHREVDYVHEAKMTEEFRTGLADDPRYVVAEVLDRYSNSEMLAMSYEHGLSLNDPQVRGLPQERRNALGRAFLDLFLTEFFDWHLVQTDPHFGNYRIRLDEDGDRIVLLDFGATRRFPRQFVSDYADIVGGALLADRERIIAGAQGIGLMSVRFPSSVLDAFYGLCRLIVEPFCRGEGADRPEALFTADGAYRYGESDLPSRVTATISRNALTRYFRIPPREIVFLHRRLAGLYIALAHLDVELDGREALDRALAGVNG